MTTSHKSVQKTPFGLVRVILLWLLTAGGMRPHKTLVVLIFFSSTQQKGFCCKSTILCDTANKKYVKNFQKTQRNLFATIDKGFMTVYNGENPSKEIDYL